MRDILVTIIVFGLVPFILARPHWGIYAWSWLGYMNPHRLTWGFAYTLPFAQVVALATLVAMVFSKEKKSLPMEREVIILACFVLWMILTTFFALEPEFARIGLETTLKIQVMVFVTLMLINNYERLERLVWVVVLSLGFYGIKGGVFSILTLGNYRVWGPKGSFIEGNNEIGLALVVLTPLVWFLYQISSKRLVKLMLLGIIFLCFVSIIGTHSRGALLGLVAMGGFLVAKSKRKALAAALVVLAIPVVILGAPEHWKERMSSISNYKEDASAMGRINAWTFAVNVANDRPLVGGGYHVFTNRMFERYAPNPYDYHDAHSIYFEVLGEHGYVGLFLYLIFLLTLWRSGTWILKNAKGHSELNRLIELTRMLQVSIIGYCASGAFLGLAYFDLFYSVAAMMIIAKVLVKQHLQETGKDTASSGQSFYPKQAH